MHLRVKECAEQRGHNMSSLSRASDVSFSTIKRLWIKPQSDATLSTMRKIARALDVEISDLVEFKEQ